jgi:Domain of unknown function (DUF4129)
MKSGGRIPPLLAVLAVLVLVGIVAVASTGSTPSGTSAARQPSDLLLDTLFSLTLLMLLPAAVILVYGLMQRKAIQQEIASGRYRRTSLTGFLVFVVIVMVIVYFRVKDVRLVFGGPEEGGAIGPDGSVDVPEAGADDPTAYEAEFAWIPVLVIVALAAAGVAAYVLAARRHRADQDLQEGIVAEQLADVLDDTLDDLRAEPDARVAVIAAYARLERSLAAAGLPRRRQETSWEYVPRVLEHLEVDGNAVRRLTDLFTQAKFSRHVIDDVMKLAAITALERVRDDLRASARRAEEERRREQEHGEQAPAL